MVLSLSHLENRLEKKKINNSGIRRSRNSDKLPSSQSVGSFGELLGLLTIAQALSDEHNGGGMTRKNVHASFSFQQDLAETRS
ncbi:hypothetical protein V1477_020554 [Vespula maculifrons]|uniref:Uncharacterized protein n=1 Tax=Vespula maculifrons TaxID=7453 RepID=A0ABD2AMA3_VESMC